MKIFITQILITVFIQTIYGIPIPMEEMSVLEYSPGYNTYGHQQMKVALERNIRPLVDTIREEEKYGNDGKLRIASQAIIKLTEGVSAKISNALGTPSENTFNILKPFDPILTDLGNKLGGLA